MDKSNCPLIPRVNALEVEQQSQGEQLKSLGVDLKNICKSVQRLADSVEKLADIIPAITLAKAVRTVAVWTAPIIASVAAISSGIYWLLGKING